MEPRGAQLSRRTNQRGARFKGMTSSGNGSLARFPRPCILFPQPELASGLLFPSIVTSDANGNAKRRAANACRLFRMSFITLWWWVILSQGREYETRRGHLYICLSMSSHRGSITTPSLLLRRVHNCHTLSIYPSPYLPKLFPFRGHSRIAA